MRQAHRDESEAKHLNSRVAPGGISTFTAGMHLSNYASESIRVQVGTDAYT